MREPRLAVATEQRQAIAALKALVFALNVIAMRHSREARMYPPTLDATLGQVWFFARAARLGGALNYAGASILAVAASAATLVAVPVFILERASGFSLTGWAGKAGGPLNRNLATPGDWQLLWRRPPRLWP